MSNKLLLRKTRKATIINGISKRQEKEVITSLREVVNRLQNKFPFLTFIHLKKLTLN